MQMTNAFLTPIPTTCPPRVGFSNRRARRAKPAPAPCRGGQGRAGVTTTSHPRRRARSGRDVELAGDRRLASQRRTARVGLAAADRRAEAPGLEDAATAVVDQRQIAVRQ